MLRTSISAEQRRRGGPRHAAALGRWVSALVLSSVAVAANDPTVEFTTTTSSGGEAGGVLVTTLSLSATSASDVTVPFTDDGTLTLGDDYTIDTVSPVTIPAGQLSVDITLTGVDDALDEADETWTLTLGAPTGATLGTNTTHEFTLTDDDDPPSVDFAVASQAGAEGAGAMTVDLNLSAVSGREISVPFDAAGLALDPDDYTLSANPVVIPAGAASATLTITPADDSIDEEDEDAVLTLQTPTHATLGATVVHTATLQDDDDPPTVQYTLASQSGGEDDGAVAVEVTLSGESGK